MTPWELAKTTEHSHQKALFAWANCVAMYGWEIASKPEGYSAATRTGPIIPVPALALLFAIHNQGHGDAIRGGKAKAEGVKAGVPDMMLPVPIGEHAGLFIELKVDKGRVSDSQKNWLNALMDKNYCVEIAYGWLDAAKTIRSYMRNYV